jgi:hypothetical protein
LLNRPVYLHPFIIIYLFYKIKKEEVYISSPRPQRTIHI